MKAYRLHPTLCLLLSLSTTALAEKDLVTIDVSGKKGNDGKARSNYSSSQAPEGTTGKRGADATEAEPGEHAGTIEVRLATEVTPEGTFLILEGRKQGAHLSKGSEWQEVKTRVPIGNSGYLVLRAQGGDGGSGGDGQDGQRGGKGSDGSDATQFSSGTDGDRGARGGDAGNGSNGKNGGDAGSITVKGTKSRKVDTTDTFILVEALNRPGKAGAAGKNGDPGRGGQGGDGGSGYSWTTYRTEYHQVPDGKGGTTTAQRQVPQHHYNPGGSDGPSGSSGDEATANPVPGKAGAKAPFRIVVETDGGSKEYGTRYRLHLESLRLRDANGDGIFEPGERVTVESISIGNDGEMELPEKHPVTIQLMGNNWVKPLEISLEVPRSLGAGKSHTFDKTLAFDIPEVEPSVDRPLSENAAANARAHLGSVSRDFPEFPNAHPFHVEFPLKLEAIEGMETLAPGQAGRYKITVRNASQAPYGAESDLKRIIATHFNMDPSDVQSHLVLMDNEGAVIPWEKGVLHELSTLEPGESKTVEATVGVLPGAPKYQQAVLLNDLRLGGHAEPAIARAVQRNHFDLRIGQKYLADQEADILLVTNHATEEGEVKAWEEMAERLGQKINVHDLSINPKLDLSAIQAGGLTLLQSFRGKTLVILNNSFEMAGSSKLHGEEMLKQQDLIKAAASYGIRVLVVNDVDNDTSSLFSDRLVPTDSKIDYTFANARAFQQGRSNEGEADRLVKQVGMLESAGGPSQIDPTEETGVIRVDGIRAPNEKRLKKEAVALQRTYEATHPGERLVVAYEMPVEGDTKATNDGLFFTHVRQGTLYARPTLGDGQPNVIVLESENREIHDPRYVKSRKVVTGFLYSLPFESKIALLNRIATDIDYSMLEPEGDLSVQKQREENMEMGRKLVDAISADVATRMASIMKTNWDEGLGAKGIRAALKELKLLAEQAPELMPPDAPQSELMTRLIGNLKFLANKQVGWNDFILLPWSPWRRGRSLRSEANRFIDDVAKTSLGTSYAEHFGDKISARVGELNAIAKKEKTGSRRGASIGFLRTQTGADIKLDATTPFERVLSAATWRGIVDNENKRADHADQQDVLKSAQKAEFLLADEGRATGNHTVVMSAFESACAAALAKLPRKADEGDRAADYGSILPSMGKTRPEENFLDRNRARQLQ